MQSTRQGIEKTPDDRQITACTRAGKKSTTDLLLHCGNLASTLQPEAGECGFYQRVSATMRNHGMARLRPDVTRIPIPNLKAYDNLKPISYRAIIHGCITVWMGGISLVVKVSADPAQCTCWSSHEHWCAEVGTDGQQVR